MTIRELKQGLKLLLDTIWIAFVGLLALALSVSVALSYFIAALWKLWLSIALILVIFKLLA